MHFKIKPSKFDITKLKKLPRFGANNKMEPFDFEWPTKQEDIKPSSDGNPVQVVAIHWKEDSAGCKGIGAMKLELSNGQMSPDFLAKNENA